MLTIFFFNDTASTEIYTLSLHDALPILQVPSPGAVRKVMNSYKSGLTFDLGIPKLWQRRYQDRKSTRLNSSHANISYAVFCLKKKSDKKIVGRMTRFLYNRFRS